MEDEYDGSPSRAGPGRGNAKGPEARKRLRLTNSVFRVNDETEGGRVKANNSVLKKRMDECGTQPHVNCRVQSLGSIMDNFCERKLGWVTEMGFGGLLHLRGKSLPRGLCYWLMTKVDPLNCVFIPSPGREYLLHKNQVHWVLGIPYGPKRVPRLGKADAMKRFVDGVYETYGVVTPGKTKYISVAKVMHMVERECVEEDELEFKKAFLALALADVLCPTTCMRLAANLVPALSVAGEAGLYDWSGLVLDNLMASARKFAMNFYRDGFAKGCGGCTYFLAIYYLDRLNRVPVKWGLFPRCRAWDEQTVNKVKNDDKLEQQPRSDFGRCEFLDVAYGELHPRGARDTLGPQSLASEVAKHLAGEGVGEAAREREREVVDTGDDESVNNGVGRKRRQRRKGPLDNSNPYLRKLAKKARMAEGSSGLGNGNNTQAHGNEEVYHCSAFGVQNTIESIDSRGLVENNGGKGNTRSSAQVLDSSALDDDYSDARVDNVVMSLVQNPDFEPLACPTSTYMWARDSLSGSRYNCNDILFNSGASGNMQLNFNFDNGVFEVLDNEVPAQDDIPGRLSPARSAPTEGQTDFEVGGVSHGYLSEDCTEGRSPLVGHCTDKKLGRSRKRRGTKPSGTLKDKDFVVDVVPRRNPNKKSKLLKYVRINGAVVDHEKDLQASDRTQEDHVMLKVGDLAATLSNCYSLVAPTKVLEVNYVRVVASLYTLLWKKKYGESSVRYMLDPTFAITVLKEAVDGPPSGWQCSKMLAQNYANSYSGLPAERFHVIFVPVVQETKWWCAGFCVNTEEVWVIDPTELNPDDVHDGFLHRLSFGVDVFLHSLDSSWAVGASASWVRKPVLMEPRAEGCGLRMLIAVKACADRYKSEISSGTSLEEECGWLLADDVMDDHNEAKAVVKELISRFQT